MDNWKNEQVNEWVNEWTCEWMSDSETGNWTCVQIQVIHVLLPPMNILWRTEVMLSAVWEHLWDFRFHGYKRQFWLTRWDSFHLTASCFTVLYGTFSRSSLTSIIHHLELMSSSLISVWPSPGISFSFHYSCTTRCWKMTIDDQNDYWWSKLLYYQIDLMIRMNIDDQSYWWS